jgi:hypothetical protein
MFSVCWMATDAHLRASSLTRHRPAPAQLTRLSTVKVSCVSQRHCLTGYVERCVQQDRGTRNAHRESQRGRRRARRARVGNRGDGPVVTGPARPQTSPGTAGHGIPGGSWVVVHRYDRSDCHTIDARRPHRHTENTRTPPGSGTGSPTLHVLTVFLYNMTRLRRPDSPYYSAGANANAAASEKSEKRIARQRVPLTSFPQQNRS